MISGSSRLIVYPAPNTKPSIINNVLCLGQSNMSGYLTDATKGGTSVPAGVTLDMNGSRLTTYSSTPGPVPYLIDQLISRGTVASNLYVGLRAIAGETIYEVHRTRLPLAFSDFNTAGKTPDVCWIWHGESASITQTEAELYEDNLMKLMLCIRAYWPNCHIYQQELLTTLAGTYPYHETVRTAQRQVKLRVSGSELVPSFEPSAIPVSGDEIHVLSAGASEAASRAAALMTA